MDWFGCEVKNQDFFYGPGQNARYFFGREIGNHFITATLCDLACDFRWRQL